jgi:hypothetical protein
MINDNSNEKKLNVKEVVSMSDVAQVMSWILFVLTLPVVGAAFLNVMKILITLILPKSLVSTKMGYKKGTMRFANSKRGHLNVQRNPEELSNDNFLTTVIYPTIDWVVKKIDWLADKYIKALSRVLKMVPKFKDKSDDELKHIAVTVYYTITIGVLMKVVKILLYKKGLSGDGAALGTIRNMITSGLKFGSYGLDFDDIEKESNVIFSNKSFAPIAQQVTDIGGVYGKVFEVNDNKIRYRDFYDV